MMSGNSPYSDSDLDKLAGQIIDDMEEKKSDSAGWLTTFSDLMSLLLVFFVMLYAISEVEVQKFVDVAKSLRQGFGASTPEDYRALIEDMAEEEMEDTGFAKDDVDEELGEIEEKLQSFVAENDLENVIEVTRDRTGVTLKIQDVVLFDPGRAVLKQSSMWIVENLNVIVQEIAVPLIIAGHTDTTPISTERYPSNWELSGARASTLARYFISAGLHPRDLHIEGYAATRPVAPNETAIGRAQNRRVELKYTRQNVFEKLIREQLEEQGAGESAGT